MNRRDFIARSAAATVGLATKARAAQSKLYTPERLHRSNHQLRIAPLKLELTSGVQIATVGYNGTVPGPLLRLQENTPVSIDVFNNTDVPELVHWHGLAIDSLSDGAMEEGSPMIPAGGHLRYTFTPKAALPRHQFRVVALDGNPVPAPTTVHTISLGVAERVDTIVEMDSPGVWVLGSTRESERSKGLGLVIEYAEKRGSAQWIEPDKSDWNYLSFGKQETHPAPQSTFPMVFQKIIDDSNGVERWTINGRSFPNIPPFVIEQENDTDWGSTMPAARATQFTFTGIVSS